MISGVRSSFYRNGGLDNSVDKSNVFQITTFVAIFRILSTSVKLVTMLYFFQMH